MTSPEALIDSTRPGSAGQAAGIDFDWAYGAFERRDRSLDGRFVGAVLTTGIYCKPSCPARRPRRENVVFYADGAAARAAGFRACRHCLPDEVGRDRIAVERAVALLQGTMRPGSKSWPRWSAMRRTTSSGCSSAKPAFRPPAMHASNGPNGHGGHLKRRATSPKRSMRRAIRRPAAFTRKPERNWG